MSVKDKPKDGKSGMAEDPSSTSLDKRSSKSVAIGNDDGDISSLMTLKAELSGYFKRSDTEQYHELYPGVERIHYDFTAERQNIYSTNLIESASHLIKGCLGAGVMGIHEGYMHGGLWTSLGMNLVLGILVTHCMGMLISSAQIMYERLRVPRLSYPDLVEVAVATGPVKPCRRYSKAFRYTLEVILFIEFNGTCCVYKIMMATTLKKVLEAIWKTAENLGLSIRLYILMITLPLIALCLIRSLKYLALFSIVADIVIGVCVIITMYYSITLANDISERPGWKNVHGFFRFCGVCIYSIDGIGVSLPIENHMRRPQYFNLVLQCAMSIVIPVVMIVGFFGYWAWGENCRSPITDHMSTSALSILLQVLLTASLGVTFAVHFFVPFRIIWHYLGKKHKKKRGVWERVYRTAHLLTITCIAVAFPNMSRLMAFMGSFFMAFMVFLFPALIETLVKWNQPRRGSLRWTLIKNIFLILFGLTMCASTFTTFENGMSDDTEDG